MAGFRCALCRTRESSARQARGALLFNRLHSAAHIDLLRDIRTRLGACANRDVIRAPMLDRFRRESGLVFNADFEQRLWRTLACNLAFLPDASVEYLHISNEELRRLQVGDDAEWLKEPWDIVRGRRLVRGSRQEFRENATGGPRTRCEALFGMRHEFHDLRQSFLA